jgi:hypothetical protein
MDIDFAQTVCPHDDLVNGKGVEELVGEQRAKDIGSSPADVARRSPTSPSVDGCAARARGLASTRCRLRRL